MFRTDCIYSGDAEITVDSFNALSADYIDPATMKELTNYSLYIDKGSATATKKWYAIYLFNVEAEAVQIKKLIAARAEKLGLLPATTLVAAPTDDGKTYFTGSGNKATAVALRVR